MTTAKPTPKDALAVPAVGIPLKRRVRPLPLWMRRALAAVCHPGTTLKDAAKVVREFARQVKTDGHKDFARHALKIAGSLEQMGTDGFTWAQAFELDLEKQAPARRWRE